MRGAHVAGLIKSLPSAALTELSRLIDAGSVKTVVSVGEDLSKAGLSAEQLSKVSVIYVGTHANATSASAKVVIPSLTSFEKNGSFINQQFRIQRFAKAVPGPEGVSDDVQVLAKLAGAAGAAVPSDLGLLWEQIAREVPALGTVRYSTIPDTGLLIDNAPWALLPFVEGETLHYKPAAKIA